MHKALLRREQSKRKTAWPFKLGQCLRKQNGTAAIEFGIIAPVALMMIAGLIEYGILTYDRTSLENAARAGAHYAFAIEYNEDKVAETAINASTLTFGPDDTVSLGLYCECSDGSEITCGEPCADAGPNRRMIRVEIVKSYQPFMPLMDYLVPDQLRGIAMLRIQ
jgi:hypothetical protein